MDWVIFDRRDPSVVVELIRGVATAGDPGEYGDGVEVVVEAPAPSFLRDVFGAEPASAHIAVTKPGGEVGYPFHVRLVSDQGGDAARRAPRRGGWAISNSAGLAFLMQKGVAGAPYDWADLVKGAIAALTALRTDAGDSGWRAAVDRTVFRAHWG
ncbi:hypothetical protein RB614_01370 [Phytohabitans sp. ZYX-F-186]|uniref:Uncharacterized protein n=1 Tax=Phytohabitans maris TaxID=3071409 RepID=A0ABU0Z7Y0_9ACTN|nr:hypothetical protein [Phytohabitans sp. ZYX-F-186]MDQ7903169.1 hypothetical protein [Phytohabitans sp. ZYX-F-186]